MTLPWVLALLCACGSGGMPTPDAGSSPDSGVPDAGVPDSGVPDAGNMDAGAADTWSNWANADFFQRYCTSCHTPGSQGDPTGANLDFTGYTDVAAKAAEIRCGTAVTQDPAWGCAAFPPAKQFPVGTGPKPTDAERDRLVAWIDAGFPQ
jgi:hypothetical protein